MKPSIANGTICHVRIRDARIAPGKFKQGRIARRVFKWTEQRFGVIPCYVFSAPCRDDVRVAWNPEERSLTISGKSVPRSEVSVPHYDLEFCEPIKP